LVGSAHNHLPCRRHRRGPRAATFVVLGAAFAVVCSSGLAQGAVAPSGPTSIPAPAPAPADSSTSGPGATPAPGTTGGPIGGSSTTTGPSPAATGANPATTPGTTGTAGSAPGATGPAPGTTQGTGDPKTGTSPSGTGPASAAAHPATDAGPGPVVSPAPSNAEADRLTVPATPATAKPPPPTGGSGKSRPPTPSRPRSSGASPSITRGSSPDACVATCLRRPEGNKPASQMLQLLAAAPSLAASPRSTVSPSHSEVAHADGVGPGGLPWTPGAPVGPRQSGAAPGGGVSPFGGAFSVGAVALLVASVDLTALFFVSLILALARWRSAFVAPLERPG
jgi:hypothetical protein